MKIIREFRKSISIRVLESGEVVVKAPLFLTKNKIEEFILSKKKWISKQLSKLKAKEEVLKQYNFEENVYLNGNVFNWDKIRRDNRQTKASFYSEKAITLLKRAEQVSNKLKIKANFKLCSSMRIWGSCSSESLIKLNWKLIILPIELQYYVIYHELCHTIHMNHSKEFWKQVEKYIPEYKKHQIKLKNLSFILSKDIC